MASFSKVNKGLGWASRGKEVAQSYNEDEVSQGDL